jgi:hypothetical protein
MDNPGMKDSPRVGAILSDTAPGVKEKSFLV